MASKAPDPPGGADSELAPEQQRAVRHLLEQLVERYGTQSAVARASGLSQQTISNVLKGKANPGRKMQRKLEELETGRPAAPIEPLDDGRHSAPEPEPPRQQVVVNEEHEALLNHAYVHGRHTLLASAAVRELLRTHPFSVRDDADPVANVRHWLDAAVRLQRRKELMVPNNILLEASRKTVEMRWREIEFLNTEIDKGLRARGIEPPGDFPDLLKQAMERARAADLETDARLRAEVGEKSSASPAPPPTAPRPPVVSSTTPKPPTTRRT